MTIAVLAEHGEANTVIARQLGVTESTVRYHRRRIEEGLEDGRGNQKFRASEHAAAIERWVRRCDEEQQGVNVVDLHRHLVETANYSGSCRNLRRYVRSVYGPPKIRAFRRVETPAGAQTQTDWAEYPSARIRGEERPLHAFLMSLSHSRGPAVVWSERENEVSWLHCHNEAFRRLGGVAAVNRIDNTKTAIATGAGAWGTIHPAYRAYSRSMGFHVDACAPHAPYQKGKVEAKVRLSRLLLDPTGKEFGSIEELQSFTDARIEKWAANALCPATGTSVAAAWEAERALLRPLPAFLPEPFDVVARRPVHKDCMIRFEGRQYAVPFRCVGRHVEVRGCATKVQVLFEDVVVVEYRRGSAERVLIDPRCYEGESTDGVIAPPPLGRMGRRLEEIRREGVAVRSIDIYAALAEVAR